MLENLRITSICHHLKQQQTKPEQLKLLLQKNMSTVKKRMGEKEMWLLSGFFFPLNEMTLSFFESVFLSEVMIPEAGSSKPESTCIKNDPIFLLFAVLSL